MTDKTYSQPIRYNDGIVTLERKIHLALIHSDDLHTPTSPMAAWYLQAALDALRGDLKEAEHSAMMAATT